VSFPAISSADGDELAATSGMLSKRLIPSKKALPAVFASKAFGVETTGIEPATSGLQSQRSPS